MEVSAIVFVGFGLIDVILSIWHKHDIYDFTSNHIWSFFVA
jgi:hypothetical protein